jgi:hypothetical protein
VTRTLLSIRVDLAEGHGEQYWPRPGRIFAAARSHTFKQLSQTDNGRSRRADLECQVRFGGRMPRRDWVPCPPVRRFRGYAH